MNEFLLIMGMFTATFAIRYVAMTLVSRIELPELVFSALRYVPVAVLSAIILPMMFLDSSGMAIRINNAYLVAGLISIGVAIWKKDTLLTIVVGMASFLLWRMLF